MDKRTTFRQVLIATDSMSTLQKIKCGRLHSDWVDAIDQGALTKITWLFCPGHSGVNGNERADELAGEAELKGELTLDPPAVLLLVKESFVTDSSAATDSYNCTRLINSGVQRGDGRQSKLRGSFRRRHNQIMISMHTLTWILEEREENIWQCAECSDSN